MKECLLSVISKFKLGNNVLLLATNRFNKLSVCWIGPGITESQISETNYVTRAPGRREVESLACQPIEAFFKRVEILNVFTRERCNFDENRDLEIPYPLSDLFHPIL